MNHNIVPVIFYYNQFSEIIIFQALPSYEEIITSKNAFLSKFGETSEELTLVFNSILRLNWLVDNENTFNSVLKSIEDSKLNKIQLYLINKSKVPLPTSETQIQRNEIQTPEDAKQIKIEKSDDENNSTSLLSEFGRKSRNESLSIKKSEKHVKALFSWARIAKDNLNSFPDKLVNENYRYLISINERNKNCSLTSYDIHTKKRVLTRQLLISKDSFNFNWTAEEGATKIQNMILYLVKNFAEIEKFHDLREF